ncbi:unnamed protein product [Brassica rapa]|uniref:Uncharacterized protein n=1 Tax=Brassica campestris TaxID=3711 RepID=A0A8D9DEM3_BRACM|nr:unnamed protein product [Brassica rapa]
MKCFMLFYDSLYFLFTHIISPLPLWDRSLHLYQMESMTRETYLQLFLKRWAFQSQGDHLLHS